jgi:hypothetical protein
MEFDSSFKKKQEQDLGINISDPEALNRMAEAGISLEGPAQDSFQRAISKNIDALTRQGFARVTGYQELESAFSALLELAPGASEIMHNGQIINEQDDTATLIKVFYAGARAGEASESDLPFDDNRELAIVAQFVNSDGQYFVPDHERNQVLNDGAQMVVLTMKDGEIASFQVAYSEEAFQHAIELATSSPPAVPAHLRDEVVSSVNMIALMRSGTRLSGEELDRIDLIFEKREESNTLICYAGLENGLPRNLGIMKLEIALNRDGSLDIDRAS